MYLPERDLLLLFLDHDFYQQHFEELDHKHIRDNYRELAYLYDTVKVLHEEHAGTSHTIDTLRAYFFVRHPDADKDLYLGLFQTLSELTIDPAIGVGILKQINQRKQALKLSEEAVKFATGYSDLTKIKEVANGLLLDESVEPEEDPNVVSDDLAELLSQSVSRHGLRWRLNCLNRSLGSLRDGDFGFIFARPETGKTTFLASEVSYMLEHLSDDVDAPVLWINMEEQGRKVMLRVYQAYFGITLQQLYTNPQKYQKEWQRQVAGRLKMVDNAGISRAEVDRLCKRYKPCLLLTDQTSKVKGFTADREDLKLGSAFLWSRELAKEYCPVIGVHQADGHAENVKWLTMEHVANVKTAAQAEADWIMGIGKINADGSKNSRYLNISKNKLEGDEDTNPELRHGQFEVYLEAQVARYIDIVDYK